MSKKSAANASPWGGSSSGGNPSGFGQMSSGTPNFTGSMSQGLMPSMQGPNFTGSMAHGLTPQTPNFTGSMAQGLMQPQQGFGNEQRTPMQQGWTMPSAPPTPYTIAHPAGLWSGQNLSNGTNPGQATSDTFGGFNRFGNDPWGRF